MVELAQIFKSRPCGRKIVPSTLLFCAQKAMVAMVTKETEEEQWIPLILNKRTQIFIEFVCQNDALLTGKLGTCTL